MYIYRLWKKAFTSCSVLEYIDSIDNVAWGCPE